MTTRELWDAIGMVDDDLILEADRPPLRKVRPLWLRTAAPLAAGLLLVAGSALALHRTGFELVGGSDSAMAAAGAPENAEAAPRDAVLPENTMLTEGTADAAQNGGEPIAGEAPLVEATVALDFLHDPGMLPLPEGTYAWHTGDLTEGSIEVAPGEAVLLPDAPAAVQWQLHCADGSTPVAELGTVTPDGSLEPLQRGACTVFSATVPPDGVWYLANCGEQMLVLTVADAAAP